MAQKIQTLLIDDIDGGEAEGTVHFGLEGSQYEIELSTEHAKELRAALARYIEAARRVGGTGRRAGQARRKPAADGISNVEVRAWAKANGIEIKDRGRISSALVDQYKAAAGK